MPIFGAFAAPTQGMMAQSSSFASVSQNITNMNTGGYKGVATRFSTVLASTYSNNKDIGGVLPLTKASIDLQGRILSTTNNLDLAINGHGFFVVNTEVDGSGDEVYTRDGGFSIRKNGTASKTVSYDDGTTSSFTVDKGYLVDKNGLYVQAWEPDSAGKFTTSSSMVSVRLDNDAFDSEASATSDATLAANLPAESDPGDEYVTKASAYTSDGTLKTFELVWKRDTTAQVWDLRIRSDDSGESNADSTIDGASTTPNYSSPVTLTFGTDGHLDSADTSQSISITYTNGDTLSFDLDITDVTSIGQSFIYDDFQKDGRGPGELMSYRFDDQGQILGRFSNGIERALYKLPLATFVNADGLEMRQGNIFATSVASGDPVYRQVRDPDVVVTGNNQEKHEFANFVPFAQELSNVNLENEFSRMILTQQAYNMSATVFKSVDEMTQTAAELKS
jgi:flagellar hook protein FlgE